MPSNDHNPFAPPPLDFDMADLGFATGHAMLAGLWMGVGLGALLTAEVIFILAPFLRR